MFFFLWKRKRKLSVGNRIFVHYGIVSTVKTEGLFVIGCHI